MKQKFSVLLSVCDKDCYEYLSYCLESIWDYQNLKPNEIVIVKDGKLDQSKNDLISNFQKRTKGRAKIIDLKKNLGLGNALFVGLNECSYDFVARMDADDISMPERFQSQMSYMITCKFDILGSFAKEIDNVNHIIGYRKMPVNHDEIYSSLWANSIIHSSVMFKKKKILKAGSYNSNHRRRQDYDLWFRCAKLELKFYNIPEFLLSYRVSNESIIRQTSLDYFKQGVIGFKGSSMIGLSYIYRILCFYPFIKSVLPIALQKFLNQRLKKFDPRNR